MLESKVLLLLHRGKGDRESGQDGFRVLESKVGSCTTCTVRLNRLRRTTRLGNRQSCMQGGRRKRASPTTPPSLTCFRMLALRSSVPLDAPIVSSRSKLITCSHERRGHFECRPMHAHTPACACTRTVECKRDAQAHTAHAHTPCARTWPNLSIWMSCARPSSSATLLSFSALSYDESGEEYNPKHEARVAPVFWP